MGGETFPMKIPADWREPVAYLLCTLCLFAVNNAVMDIAYVRHRWRQTILASKVIGFVAAMLIMIRPSQIAVYGLCICLFNGFADPRFHTPSIKRNPAHPLVKWFFCLTLLAHHTGGAFLVSDMLTPIIDDTSGKLLDLDIPILVSMFCELFSWFTDLKVLMRTAPKWFTFAHQVAVVIQLGACLSLLMFFPHRLCTATVVGTMVGSFSWLIAGWVGFKNSTHEVVPEVDLKASVARVYHKQHPLTQDDGILPFCKTDCFLAAGK